MCGIFGFVDHSADNQSIHLLKAAVACLHHRGPDDEGYMLFDPQTGRATPCGGTDTPASLGLPPLEALTNTSAALAFGFRRLSILDLSPAGHQPMASADGRYWILMNGEIYNYLELRQNLIQQGYSFHSGSDTEVLLAAYQQWGPSVLNRLVGMFAFAILDTHTRKLFLARDFFGIKPLYYTCQSNRFAFASEPQPLLTLPWVSRRVNPQVLYSYLQYGHTDQDSQTFFAGLLQLEPGHYMEVDVEQPGAPKITRYWSLEVCPQKVRFEEAVAGVRERFEENVRLHLRSDVPVGAALSGGIDSSAIVMTMRHILGDQLDLHTFSYIADHESLNEEKWVDLVSSAANAKVYKTHPQPADLVAALDHLISMHGEPFVSTSIFAQHAVFKLAREAGVTVMEDGQGADEMLAGYPGYLPARLVSHLYRGQLGQAVRFARSVSSGRPGISPVDFYGNALRHFAPEALLKLGVRMVGRRVAWIDERWFARQHAIMPALRLSPTADSLRAALIRSFTGNLPMLLRYEDRNSMAFSIESRVPFLTPDLVTYVLSLPEDYIVGPDGTSKYVFRQAMKGIVPDAVLNRRDKIGFATPEQNWLKVLAPWVDSFIDSEAAHSIGALNLPEIQHDWQAILMGQRHFNSRIWRLINLIRWVELFQVDGK